MIKDVHHVGIAVKDLDAALAFYSDALGLPVVKRGDVPARGVNAAMIAVGGGYLELIQPSGDSGPFAAHIADRGEGLHHLALCSTGVDADVAALRSTGVPLDDPEPREGFTGRLSYLAPEAFDGALLELVEPEPLLSVSARHSREGGNPLRAPGESEAHTFTITRIDHVVLRVPSVTGTSRQFEEWLGVPTKRTMERGAQAFAFLRPGDTVIEVIGPKDGGDPGSGRIAGLAFECKGIDELAENLKGRGYPAGEPHPALQGGRIVSVHASGACGVPVAFIDFTGSPGPPRRTPS